MARKTRPPEQWQDRQEEILTAAVAVFAEKGFSASTTSEVAKAAGVAEGTIFRYFRTKKDLLTAIVTRFVTTVGGNIMLDGIGKIVSESEGKDLRVVLKEILLDRLRLVRGMMPVFQVVLVEVLYHEEIRRMVGDTILPKARGTVQPLFDRLEAEGTLRPGLSRDTIMRTILGAFVGLVAQSVFVETDEASFDQEADRTIDLIYHGIISSREAAQ